MFYSLLGRFVWYIFTSYLRMKYGRTMMPKSLLAGATVAVALGVALAAQRARSTDE